MFSCAHAARGRLVLRSNHTSRHARAAQHESRHRSVQARRVVGRGVSLSSRPRQESSPGRPLGDKPCRRRRITLADVKTRNVSPQTLATGAVGRCHPTSTRSCADVEEQETPRLSQRRPIARTVGGCAALSRWPFLLIRPTARCRVPRKLTHESSLRLGRVRAEGKISTPTHRSSHPRP